MNMFTNSRQPTLMHSDLRRQTRRSRLLLIWNKASILQFCQFLYKIQTINSFWHSLKAG